MIQESRTLTPPPGSKPTRELAYRRGYSGAVKDVLDAFRRGVPLERLEEWAGTVREWYYDGHDWQAVGPRPPRPPLIPRD